MFRGKSKEVTAPAITGYCSQEECRNGEATVKGGQQREKTNGTQKKTGWRAALTMSVSSKI
jgi:hypothetical protein